MKELVKFPDEGYYDTGEGGLEVYLVILKDEKRHKCINSGAGWFVQDVCLSPIKMRHLNDKLFEIEKKSDFKYNATEGVDLVVLLGSTDKSLSTDQGYFLAKFKDLTDIGKTIFKQFSEIYGEDPMIVTLLDT